MKTIQNRTTTLFGVLILVFMLVMPADVFSQGPPPWAPAHGYRAKTRHIYFPDHNVYFDLQKKVYIFINGGNWSVGVSLPTTFGSINLGKSTQIQLDYYGGYPQFYNKEHKVKYKSKNKHNASGKSQSKEVFVNDKGNNGNGKGNNGNGKGNSGKGNNGKGNGK